MLLKEKADGEGIKPDYTFIKKLVLIQEDHPGFDDEYNFIINSPKYTIYTR